MAVAGALLLATLAALLVPWSAAPVGGEVPPAEEYFTPAQLARAEAFARWARLWSWSALAVSLAVACWLGLTRTGARLVGRLRGPWALRVVLVAWCSCCSPVGSPACPSRRRCTRCGATRASRPRAGPAGLPTWPAPAW